MANLVEDPLNNRPQARKDSQGFVNDEFFLEESFRGEYTGDNIIYAGFAKPGADEGSLVWQISFFTYTGDNLISIQWPKKLDENGDSVGPASNDYEFSWTDRASYTYV